MSRTAETERLYFKDSHLTKFHAQVRECQAHGDRWIAVLDRTAFYPTGGGQPNDTGRLGTAQVLDCQEEDGRILHILDQPVSGEVEGEIDQARRQDHMQQHTGQHILSQAFIKVAGAETRSFHLGAESSTIDIELATPTPELIKRAEDLANEIIFSDRSVNIHLTDEEDLSRFPLRKDTEREGCVRIIEIGDFDFSPCGGTHAHRTGEVGMIVIRGWERAKKMCRVEFLAGWRALNDYRAAHNAALKTAALFSAARDVTPELVARLQQDNKQLQRRMRELMELALDAEARKIFEAAPVNAAGTRIIQAVFANRDADELKMLAQIIVAQGAAMVLLAATGDTMRLVFARSKGLAEDCGKLMGEFCQRFGGRGGGRADFAQGGVNAGHDGVEALAQLAAQLNL